MATTVTTKQKSRLPALLLALVALMAVAGAVWWYSPWDAEKRFRRMNLVSLKRWTDDHPQDFLAWREIGMRLARDGDRLAEKSLTQAYALNQADPQVATALGELLLATQRYSEAFQILKATVEKNPKFSPARMALGKLYRRKGSYQNALEHYEAVIANEKSFTEAWYEIAYCYLKTQQLGKATAAIDEALRQRPEDAEFLALKGSIDTAVGQIDSGIAATKRAAELAPTNLRIQVNFANMLLARHRSDEDLKLAEQVIGRIEQLDPRYPLLPYQRGELARLRGQWEEAARYLEQAVRATPMQHEVYFSLSRAYRRLNRTKQADQLLAVYRHRQDLHRQMNEVGLAIQGRPNDIALYTRLADLQLQMNDRASALSSLQTALQIDPKDAKIQERLRRLQSDAPPQRAP